MKCILALLLVITGFVALAFGQPAPSPSPTAAQSEAGKRLDEYFKEEEQKKSKSAADQILPDASGIDTLDEPTKARALAAYREYYDYRISGYQHRREVFKWQLFSSKIIFAVVILLVLSGVYFSGMQFHRSLGRKRKPAFATGTANDKEASEKITVEEEEQFVAGDATQIEASLKGIKVSSSILGVIILVISLLFFYLYLVYIYPIHEIL